MPRWKKALVVVLVAIPVSVGALHIRSIVVAQAARAAVAELLDLPLAQVRLSLFFASPPRRMDVFSEDGTQKMATALVHGKYPLGITFHGESPLQRWNSHSKIGRDEAADVVRSIATELLGGSPLDIHTLDEVVVGGWTAEVHIQNDEMPPRRILINITETGLVHYVTFLPLKSDED